MSEADLTRILALSRANNEERLITGLLLYRDQSFLQILEGDRADIAQLYSKIATDSRHTQVRLLTWTSTEARSFPEWSMGFKHLNDERISRAFPGYKSASKSPLIHSDLVRTGVVAETLLRLYHQYANA